MARKREVFPLLQLRDVDAIHTVTNETLCECLNGVDVLKLLSRMEH